MDDNVVRMMPKGREQVLRSAQGVGYVRSAYSDQILRILSQKITFLVIFVRKNCQKFKKFVILVAKIFKF